MNQFECFNLGVAQIGRMQKMNMNRILHLVNNSIWSRFQSFHLSFYAFEILKGLSLCQYHYLDILIHIQKSSGVRTTKE